jgi:DNA mismatch repair protein MutS2
VQQDVDDLRALAANDLESGVPQIPDAPTASRREVQEVQKQSSALLRQLLERRHRQPRRREAPPAQELAVGGWVHVDSLDQSGKLLALDRERNSAEVQLGSFKVRVKASELRPGHRPAAGAPDGPPRPRERPPEEAVVTVPPAPAAGLELDLRGRRAADVESELDRFLNDASRAGLPYARIIHGKGTGALRQVVQEQLAGHPLVQSFRLGESGEGGDGVTIATL